MNQQLNLLKEEINKGNNAKNICDLIITSAMEAGSNYISIEPFSDFVIINFKIEGLLKEITKYETFIHKQIIARYKMITNLNINESDIQQDGFISNKINEKGFDLYISTIPTVNGEKIIIKINYKYNEVKDFLIKENEKFKGDNIIPNEQKIIVPEISKNNFKDKIFNYLFITVIIVIILYYFFIK